MDEGWTLQDSADAVMNDVSDSVGTALPPTETPPVPATAPQPSVLARNSLNATNGLYTPAAPAKHVVPDAVENIEVANQFIAR